MRFTFTFDTILNSVPFGSLIDRIMSSSSINAALGSLGIVPLIPCPPLPLIITEWAAILPLICHLASQRDDYVTTGDVALQGKLSIGLFPRLGTLSGISRLLERGTEYLDFASTKGGSSRTVWDVKWGSVFPCANGAAIGAISAYLLSRNKESPTCMPETPSHQTARQNSEKSSIKDDPSSTPAYMSYSGGSNPKEQGSIRRFQTLHVYEFHRSQKRSSLGQRFRQFLHVLPVQVASWVLLMGLAVFFLLFGCYGTCAIVVCSTISEIVAHNVKMLRSPTYLKNSEHHDACMLVAAHENATEWHLYIGDRAIVDSLLNKQMFIVPSGPRIKFAATWFWFAHLFQLAAMSFVAAQKGWDGVCLITLLTTHLAFYFFHSSRGLAQDWLEAEGIDARVKSFKFSGRFGLIGAIQLFSGSTVTRWMDTILAPHARREAWLEWLQGVYPAGNLDVTDASWVQFSSDAAFAGAEVLMREFTVVSTPSTSA
ncbi:unnamed protein product [Clonostachys byssicola]|uniref:Uncharacterized protein n=1 Tax=Clonostachys byssicola TaxID=160290 RepID=A0A9N9UF34_9HYPO|nr:unnamed protein product [Clonostachys byssicola]